MYSRDQQKRARVAGTKQAVRQERYRMTQEISRNYQDGTGAWTGEIDGMPLANPQGNLDEGLQVTDADGKIVKLYTWDELYARENNGEAMPTEKMVDDEEERIEREENGQMSAEERPSALERIPKDENGNPVFGPELDPSLAWDAMVEYYGGDSAGALQDAQDMLKQKRGELSKLEKEGKKSPKGNTIAEKRAAREVLARQVDAARKEADFWQGVVSEAENRREARQSQTENQQNAQTENQQPQETEQTQQQTQQQSENQQTEQAREKSALEEMTGMTYGQIREAWGKDYADLARSLAEQAKAWGLPCRILVSGKEYEDEAKRAGFRMPDRTKSYAFGNYHNGTIYICVQDIFDYARREDINAEGKGLETLAHEGLAHFGLRAKLGTDEFNAYCDRVFRETMTQKQRQEAFAHHWDYNMTPAQKREYLGLDGNAEVPAWKDLTDKQRKGIVNGKDEVSQRIRRGAADEYIASVAEKVQRGDELDGGERKLWERIVDWFRQTFGNALTERDIADELAQVRSMAERGELGQAESARTEGNAFSAEERGYEGRSQSTRAKEAREEGKFPMTDFTKEYDIPKESVSLLTGLGLIDDSEWHHTGPNYARTTFYGWSADGALEAYRDNKKEIDRLAREYSAVPETELRSDYGYDKDNIVPSLMSESDRRAYDALLDEHRHDGNYDGEEYDRRRDEYARERERLFAPYRDTEEYRRNAEAVDRYESGREENRARRESIEGQAREVLGETASMFSAEERNEGKALEEIISDSDYEKMELSGDEKAEIENVNDKFNEKLDTFNETNSDRLIFSLGRPTSILRSAGVHDKPMRLHGSKIMKKVRKHGFDPKELRNLPRNVADPIAVFNNKKSEDNRAVLTELRTANGNFLVTIDLGKGSDVDFNIISSVFGKGDDNIADWLKQGYDTYINKEKALEFLFHQSTLNVAAAANEGLVSENKGSENSVTSKENGENPQFSAEERDDNRITVRNESGFTMTERERKETADYLMGNDYASELTGNEFPMGEESLVKRVVDFYNKNYNGRVFREGIGEIILNSTGVWSSIRHGLRRNKVVAFAAVPEIITKGRIIDTNDDWEGNGYDSVTIAAPIKIKQGIYIGTVIITKGKNASNFRFYLHKVNSKKNLLNEQANRVFSTNAIREEGIAKVLRNILFPNINSENSNFSAEAREFSDADTRFSVTPKDEIPTKTGKAYKVFVLKDGKLYPPKVNPTGQATPVGEWVTAETAPIAGTSKTGRAKVKATDNGLLANRPGWHLGEIPYAIQFNRMDGNRDRTLFPADFVWAECEYDAGTDYAEEAHNAGVNAAGNFQHSLASLDHLPEGGFYKYRTNPDPRTDDWIITDKMRVNHILTDAEVDDIVRQTGREPQTRQKRDNQERRDRWIDELNRQISEGQSEETTDTRETLSDIENPENDDRFSAAERVATADEARERLGVELTPEELASTSTRHGAMMTALRKATENGDIPNMDSDALLSFLSDTFRDAPEEIKSGIWEVFSESANPDIAGEVERSLADCVSREVRGVELTDAQREFLDNAAKTIAERLGISEDNAKYVLWQHANAGNDLVTDEERQAMRNALGVTTPASDYEAGVQSEVRYSAARRGNTDSARDYYEKALSSVGGMLDEVYHNEYRALDTLVDAIAAQTGRTTEGWENPKSAFNQLSSRTVAQLNAYMRDFYDPMVNTAATLALEQRAHPVEGRTSLLLGRVHFQRSQLHRQ